MSTSQNYVTPGQARQLRACMICSIVMTQTRFVQEGCPNCDQYMRDITFRGDPDTVRECTSQMFEGLIHVADPATSWVARWQRLDKYVPGMYATKVNGVLSDDVLAELESAGIKYVPRDGSAQDDEA